MSVRPAVVGLALSPHSTKAERDALTQPLLCGVATTTYIHSLKWSLKGWEYLYMHNKGNNGISCKVLRLLI